jgi:hypothetical protein
MAVLSSSQKRNYTKLILSPLQWRTGWGFKPHSSLNSGVLTKLRRIPSAVENIRNNLVRIRVSIIFKLSGTPNYGANASRSPFSLPSVLIWIYWTPPKKILDTPLVHWIQKILTANRTSLLFTIFASYRHSHMRTYNFWFINYMQETENH